MASVSAATILCLLLLFLLNSPTNADIGDVNPCYVLAAPLAPCLGAAFTRNSTDELSHMCCQGATLLATVANSPPGKVAVCQCLQTVLAQIPLITPQAARDVIGSCTVALPIPNLDTNCLTGKN